MTDDTFIGYKYGTDEHLEVVGVGDILSSGVKRYAVFCNVCAQDEELFGDAVFYSTKGGITAGRLPCGCSRAPRWSKEQHIIRAKRKCLEQAKDFIEVVGEWKGIFTKISASCHAVGHISVTTLGGLHTGVTTCPRCAAKRFSERRIAKGPDVVAKFIGTGAFLPGTLFRKSEEEDERGYKIFWEVTCPVCSKDGRVFRTTHRRLTAGRRPCDCNSHRFREDKPSSLYVIRAVSNGDKVDFTGYGITNDIEQRLTHHKCSLLKAGFSLAEMEVFPTMGNVARVVEKLVKKSFEVFPQTIEGFITEATHSHCFDEVVAFVDEQMGLMEFI